MYPHLPPAWGLRPGEPGRIGILSPDREPRVLERLLGERSRKRGTWCRIWNPQTLREAGSSCSLLLVTADPRRAGDVFERLLALQRSGCPAPVVLPSSYMELPRLQELSRLRFDFLNLSGPGLAQSMHEAMTRSVLHRFSEGVVEGSARPDVARTFLRLLVPRGPERGQRLPASRQLDRGVPVRDIHDLARRCRCRPDDVVAQLDEAGVAAAPLVRLTLLLRGFSMYAPYPHPVQGRRLRGRPRAVASWEVVGMKLGFDGRSDWYRFVERAVGEKPAGAAEETLGRWAERMARMVAGAPA